MEPVCCYSNSCRQMLRLIGMYYIHWWFFLLETFFLSLLLLILMKEVLFRRWVTSLLCLFCIAWRSSSGGGARQRYSASCVSQVRRWQITWQWLQLHPKPMPAAGSCLWATLFFCCVGFWLTRFCLEFVSVFVFRGTNISLSSSFLAAGPFWLMLAEYYFFVFLSFCLFHFLFCVVAWFSLSMYVYRLLAYFCPVLLCLLYPLYTMAWRCVV